jgi:hypothetical protein
MLPFKKYSLLSERVVSIGFDPAKEHLRDKHRQQIHDILQSSYIDAGGYGGLPSGSQEESDAIHKDIDSSLIKAVKRGDKITAVSLYKNQHGRKNIATGTNGTTQGRSDWRMTAIEDIKQKRYWAEVSGKPEHLMRKLGAPVVPVSDVPGLLGKEIQPEPDSEHYTRILGGKPHKKIVVGFPRKN